METAIYYRNEEMISQSDLDRLRKVWGVAPYTWVEEHIIDQNSGSGLHIITELLAVIWNTKDLNEREIALKERIAKGLTRSKSWSGGYVEEYILIKIIRDALKELNATTDYNYELYNVPFKEVFRLYDIPYKSVMEDVEKSEREIGTIPEPPRTVKYVRHFHDKPITDQTSCYQENYIKFDSCPISMYGHDYPLPKKIYNQFPFVGKVHKVSGDNYIQVYLYDYHGSTKGLENVLCFLEDNGVKLTQPKDEKN